jgi:hypothetical protein
MGKRDENDRGLRGGSWNNTENNLRASNRNSNNPTNESNNIGFRLASLCARMGQPIWKMARFMTETLRYDSARDRDYPLLQRAESRNGRQRARGQPW